jgi:CRISPR system Cascade subunit CasB
MQPGPSWKGDRAALARLRRVATAAEALIEPEVIDLCHKLSVSHYSRSPSPGRVAALAAVLAHVRHEVEPSEGGKGARPGMMRLVGPQSTGTDARASAKLKEIRFRALLSVRGDDELLTAMRRLVALAGGKANIRDLARTMLSWSDKTRTRWAYEYYGATASTPESVANSPSPVIENAP